MTRTVNRDHGIPKDPAVQELILEKVGRLIRCRSSSESEVCAPAFEPLPVLGPAHRPKVDSHRFVNTIVLLSRIIEFSEAIPGISEFKLRVGVRIRQSAPMDSWTRGFR